MVKNDQNDVLRQLENVVGVSTLQEFGNLVNVALSVVGSYPRGSVWLVDETRRVYDEGFRGNFSVEFGSLLGQARSLGVKNLNHFEKETLKDYFDEVFSAGDSNRSRNGLLKVAPLSVHVNGRNPFYELKESQYGFM